MSLQTQFSKDEYALYLLPGLIAGILSGLLGIGGGIIVVLQKVTSISR